MISRSIGLNHATSGGNMPQFNYLVIGLGGTGCAVIRELKKKLYIEWRSKGNTGPYPDIYSFQDEHGGARVESRIATLSIDSNQQDLAGAGELAQGWRVFGETLGLQDCEKVLLDTRGVDKILHNIQRYPGIEPWVGEELQFVRDISRGTTEPAGCNQIRRMGRIALANGNGIANVIGAVANHLQKLTENRQSGAEIHIVCTLAAGTGSGSLIDVIAQLQRYLKDKAGEYDIFIHGFTTIDDVGSKSSGNFYANQYAALMKLNAFRMETYQPWDIAASQNAARLSLSTNDLRGTFKSMALVSDHTEGGRKVPLDQQIDNVAEFIFQMAVRQMGDLPKPLRDALTLEDRKQYPADTPGGNRSTAFISYGVQRVAIPEREIREKLSYSFARQFILKVMYNHWDDRYRDQPREMDIPGFVDTRRRIWKVTKEHLYLDLVEDTSGQQVFTTYEIEWRTELNKQAERVRTQLVDKGAREQWLADFDRRAEKFWREGFRSQGEGGGLDDYFKIRMDANEIATRARRIRSHIEKDLITNFEGLEAEYPLTHLPAAIHFLIQRIDNDRVNFGGLEKKAGEEETNADRSRNDILIQYPKCGWLAKRKQERLFTDFVQATTSYYYWKTIKQAAQYGQEFCKKLVEELRLLEAQITDFGVRLKLLAQVYQHTPF